MSPENTQKLIDVFPAAFTDLDGRLPMALFGFECGDGWFDLLREALTEIKAISDRIPGIQFKVDQIKEKYGTLRFYWDGRDYEDETDFPDAIEMIVRRAEERSAKECEVCGKAAIFRSTPYFYHVYCDECENELKGKLNDHNLR